MEQPTPIATKKERVTVIRGVRDSLRRNLKSLFDHARKKRPRALVT